ncbi:MAG: HEPN domain-containing protein [Phycisphaerales bacterium]|nr:HEPN domain-containing protein [Phycisphaerales bacterium]
MDLVDVSVADHERGREVGMPLNISLDAPASQAILRLVGIAMEGARGPRPPLYKGANTTARNRTKELRKEMDGRMLVAMSLWANAAPWAPNPTTMVFGTAALECLLGDDTKADITSKLADRCMMLLEPEGQYREKARAFIVDLYKARCDIVHGSFDFVQTERIKELKSLLASVMIAMIEWLRVAESQGHERDDIKSLSLIEELDRFMRSGGVTWADGPGVARDPVYLNFVRRYWVPQEELDPTKDFLLLAKPDWYQEMVLVT